MTSALPETTELANIVGMCRIERRAALAMSDLLNLCPTEEHGDHLRTEAVDEG